jgi:hypothetical protein
MAKRVDSLTPKATFIVEKRTQEFGQCRVRGCRSIKTQAPTRSKRADYPSLLVCASIAFFPVAMDAHAVGKWNPQCHLPMLLSKNLSGKAHAIHPWGR